MIPSLLTGPASGCCFIDTNHLEPLFEMFVLPPQVASLSPMALSATDASQKPFVSDAREVNRAIAPR